MPLLKTIPIDNNGCVYLWKLTEAEAFLAAGTLLSPHSDQRLLGMKSELHRRAFLSVRHLLALAGILDTDLFYDPFGKPHLKDGSFISISHSFTLTALAVHKNIPVGIDVEMKREKILRIAHKFTPYSAQGEQDILLLTHIWACKESVYKMAGRAGLSFLKGIVVWPAADAFYGRIPTKSAIKEEAVLDFDYFELQPFEALEYGGVWGLYLEGTSAREGQAKESYKEALEQNNMY